MNRLPSADRPSDRDMRNSERHPRARLVQRAVHHAAYPELPEEIQTPVVKGSTNREIVLRALQRQLRYAARSTTVNRTNQTACLMSIIDLNEADSKRIEQRVALLVDGFSDTGSGALQTPAEALLTVRESLQSGCITRVALENSGSATGWIGGRATYSGRVWELHPLVVRRDCRGRDIGRALVKGFRGTGQASGGSTIYLGTDDENSRSSSAEWISP
jgi:hypothetical protein